MRYIDMMIKMYSDSEIILNHWLGSTLKGAIISKMKYKYCKEKTFNCDECNLNYLCPIIGLFNEKNIQGIGNTSNAIIINTFLDDVTKTKEFYINIKLIEQGILYVDIIDDILRHGIDIKSGNKVVTFRSKSIAFKDNSGNLQLDKNIMDTTKCKQKNITNTLVINIESPLKIQESAKELDFSNLLRIMMTRIDSIGILSNSKKVYSQKLIEEAKSINCIHKDINEVMLKRRSTHNNKKIEIQCYIGNLAYRGDFTNYIDILKESEIVNIGKWTTFGLGRIKVEFV